MNGAVFLLPQYAFLAWTGATCASLPDHLKRPSDSKVQLTMESIKDPRNERLTICSTRKRTSRMETLHVYEG